MKKFILPFILMWSLAGHSADRIMKNVAGFTHNGNLVLLPDTGGTLGFGGGGGGTNQQLSNLSGTVGVNLSLNPGSSGLDLGSNSIAWHNLFVSSHIQSNASASNITMSNMFINGATASGNFSSGALFSDRFGTNTSIHWVNRRAIANDGSTVNIDWSAVGQVSFNNALLTSALDPVNPQDVATKNYVDNTGVHTSLNNLSAVAINTGLTFGNTVVGTLSTAISPSAPSTDMVISSGNAGTLAGPANFTFGNLVITAVTPGSAGNGIQIVSVAGHPTRVTSVVGNTINMAFNDGGCLTGDIATAIAGNVSASALVTTNFGDGTDCSNPPYTWNLSGGTDLIPENSGNVVLQPGTSTQNSGITRVVGDLSISGILKLPVQTLGSPPTCGGPQDGSLALTSAHILCVCNGSSWVQASDGSTACTF